MKKQLPNTFRARVYATPMEVYINRLKAIGFTGKEKVLDAGCGYGQWSMALAQLNRQVVAFDADTQRIDIAQKTANEKNISNIEFKQGFLENFNFSNEKFDAVFSYSVLYLTNHKESIKNLSNLLKKEGLLYLNFNSFGIIPFILIERAVKRQEIESLDHFKQYFINLFRKNTHGLHALSVKRVIKVLQQNNMKIIALRGDGEINFTQEKIKKFYPATYWGMKNVVEILAKKI